MLETVMVDTGDDTLEYEYDTRVLSREAFDKYLHETFPDLVSIMTYDEWQEQYDDGGYD